MRGLAVAEAASSDDTSSWCETARLLCLQYNDASQLCGGSAAAPHPALITRFCRAQTAAEDKQSGHVVTVINCYFMSQGGAMFRAQVQSFPYLYLQIKVRMHAIWKPVSCRVRASLHS